MPGKDDATFADVIEDSRRVPEDAKPRGELDIPQMFSKETSNPNIGDAPDGKGLDLKYTSHSEVFLLWRPWNKCGRCSRDIEANEAAREDDPTIPPLLPDVGDYTCPHNQNSEYKNIMDRCLSGSFILRREEPFNMVDGTRCVHVTWLEVDPEQAKKLAEMEELRKQTRIHPPDLEAAFRDVETKSKKKVEQPKA